MFLVATWLQCRFEVFEMLEHLLGGQGSPL